MNGIHCWFDKHRLVTLTLDRRSRDLKRFCGSSRIEPGGEPGSRASKEESSVQSSHLEGDFPSIRHFDTPRLASSSTLTDTPPQLPSCSLYSPAYRSFFPFVPIFTTSPELDVPPAAYRSASDFDGQLVHCSCETPSLLACGVAGAVNGLAEFRRHGGQRRRPRRRRRGEQWPAPRHGVHLARCVMRWSASARPAAYAWCDLKTRG